jgi:hypothetical protein
MSAERRCEPIRRRGLTCARTVRETRRSGSVGGEFSSWEIDGDAGAAVVDVGDEGVG